MDEIAIVNEFANEGIDLPQRELWTALEIATDQAIFVHSPLEGSGAGILDRSRAELFGQREHAQDAADTRFAELVINKVAECADVSAGSARAPQ